MPVRIQEFKDFQNNWNLWKIKRIWRNLCISINVRGGGMFVSLHCIENREWINDMCYYMESRYWGGALLLANTYWCCICKSKLKLHQYYSENPPFWAKVHYEWMTTKTTNALWSDQNCLLSNSFGKSMMFGIQVTHGQWCLSGLNMFEHFFLLK